MRLTVQPAGLGGKPLGCRQLVDRVEQGVKAWPGKVAQQREELPVRQCADVGQEARRVDRCWPSCVVVEDSC